MPNLEFSSFGIRATHRLSYERFMANPRGFYVVLTNVNDRHVAGKITIKLNFTLNQRSVSLVILEQDFSLSPRDHVLEICHTNQYGDTEGNTIIGRVTPFTLQKATPQEEEWVD